MGLVCIFIVVDKMIDAGVNNLKSPEYYIG